MKQRQIAAVTSLTLIMAVAVSRGWCTRGRRCSRCRSGWWALCHLPTRRETSRTRWRKGADLGRRLCRRPGRRRGCTPVYPALVAGVFKIFGIRTAHAFYATVALNILFSVAACVPIFWIGRRAGGVGTGAVAAWMWALLPTAIIIPYQWVWDTSLAALLVATLTWATIRGGGQGPN